MNDIFSATNCLVHAWVLPFTELFSLTSDVVSLGDTACERARENKRSCCAKQAGIPTTGFQDDVERRSVVQRDQENKSDGKRRCPI